MQNLDYDYVVVENDSVKDEDVVMIVNDYYIQSDIYEVCIPTGGTQISNYVVVKDVKEDPNCIFYNVDYAL